MNNFKIAVLVTEDESNFGGPNGVFLYHVQRFQKVCQPITLIPFFVCSGQFPENIEDFSAYVITGSHYSANENHPWMTDLEQFIRQVKENSHIKMVGICFGHQIIAKALGGTVGKNPTGEFIWKCDKVEVTTEFASKQYYIDSKLGASGFYIMQSHEDQVIKKPDEGVVMGSCKDCCYEILLYGNNILTLQGHPETESEKMVGRIATLEKDNMLTKKQIINAKTSFNNDEADKTTALISNFLMAQL